MSSPFAQRSSRRDFIRTSSAAGVAVLGFPAIVRSQSPGSKLNVVIIGCGGRGGSNMAEMMGENIVALGNPRGLKHSVVRTSTLIEHAPCWVPGRSSLA